MYHWPSTRDFDDNHICAKLEPSLHEHVDLSSAAGGQSLTCVSLHLYSYFMYASSRVPCESVHSYRLAFALVARQCDQIRR